MELKFAKLEEVRKYFVNEAFVQCINRIICSLDFRNTEAAVHKRSPEQVFLNIFQYSQENNCVRLSFNKVLGLAIQLKKTLTQVSFSETCKVFKNTFFLQNTSGGCFWKYLVNSLMFVYDNNEWCHLVVTIDSPTHISFCCVCFVFFIFLLLSYFFVDSTSC